MDISDNASVTITDNDQAVLTGIDDVVVNEGDNATVTLTVGQGHSGCQLQRGSVNRGRHCASVRQRLQQSQLVDGDVQCDGDNQNPEVTVPITDDLVVERARVSWWA